MALLLLFLIAPVYESFHSTAIFNRDVWWHLRTGTWILQNHTIPHQGLFSQSESLPWIAGSWLYEALLAAGYKLLGLRIIPAVVMAFRLSLAILTFRLAGGLRGNFWGAVLLSAVAQYVVADPQPWPNIFSILFFGIELALLLQSRRSADAAPLRWLPLLFLLWANLHIQFIAGLSLLALFLVTAAAERALQRAGTAFFEAPNLPLRKIAGVAAVSTVATLGTPYTFHLFADAIKNTYGKALLANFIEMTPLAFRQGQDFVLALLLMMAFFVLGRQHFRDLFALVLMAVTVPLAFRFQRDSWIAVLCAVAVLGSAMQVQQAASTPRKSAELGSKRRILAVAAVILVVFVAGVMRLPGDQAILARASEVFPRKACDFIRASRLPGPLFNDYHWGGFLIWYLPEYPVAIDSRLTLYGDDSTESYFRITSGADRLETDPGFARARTILLDRHSALSNALTKLPALSARFQLVYEDEIAMVLLRR